MSAEHGTADPVAAGSADEVSERVVISNKRGLHARASAKFVNAVAKLPPECQVRVSKDGSDAAGGSILGLMMLGAARGDTVEIAVSGGDAQAALTKLVGLIKDGFGED